MTRIGAIIVSLLFVAACQPSRPTQQAFSVTIPPTGSVALATAVPTAQLIPTLTVTPSPTETLPPTEPATQTRQLTQLPPPTDAPVTPERAAHYQLNRPIARQGVDYIDRTYPYGDTQGGTRRVHHGVEFVNPRGTPVLAAAAGTVIHAGDDLETRFGPENGYYGNLVVIEHGFTSPEGLPVYTLYAHLDRVDVQTGDRVAPGDHVGVVGDTGIAIGPHLHFEVRVGDPQDFGATRNPDLWIHPYARFGTLAGRVTDSDGELLTGVTVQVRTADSNRVRYAFTYSDDSVNSDVAWGENFTLGDLPAGRYEVVVSDNGRVGFRKQVAITPRGLTWIDIQLE